MEQYQQLQQANAVGQAQDTASQAALMGQLNQLYGMSKDAQMTPLQMQALQDAHAQSVYGLQRGQQFDPQQLEQMRLSNEAQRYQNQVMPTTLEQTTRLNESNIAGQSLTQDALRAQNAWYEADQQLRHRTGESALTSQGLAQDAQRMQNDWAPETYRQTYAQNEFDINDMNPLRLQLGQENLRASQAQRALNLADRGGLNGQQLQKLVIGGWQPDIYNTDFKPVYDAAETQRGIVRARHEAAQAPQPLNREQAVRQAGLDAIERLRVSQPEQYKELQKLRAVRPPMESSAYTGSPAYLRKKAEYDSAMKRIEELMAPHYQEPK